MLIMSSLFDALSLLSRDLAQLHHMAKASLSPAVTSELKVRRLSRLPQLFAEKSQLAFKPPKRIILPSDWSASRSAFHIAIVDKFTSALENLLGVSRTDINLADTWQKSPPPQARSQSFQEFFHKVIHVYSFTSEY